MQGVLGVSRSFGDIEYKTLREKSWGAAITADLVIATPAIKIVEIVPEDEFIIIASDGLFDVSPFATLMGYRLLYFFNNMFCPQVGKEMYFIARGCVGVLKYDLIELDNTNSAFDSAFDTAFDSMSMASGLESMTNSEANTPRESAEASPQSPHTSAAAAMGARPT